MTKINLKTIAQRALESEYGFKPAKSDIVLLESDGTGTYIMFSVNGKEYQFRSHLCNGGSVWAGSGTITKCDA